MTNHTEQTLEMVEEQLDRDYRIRTHSFKMLDLLKRAEALIPEDTTEGHMLCEEIRQLLLEIGVGSND
jgi:hypothetical protein